MSASVQRRNRRRILRVRAEDVGSDASPLSAVLSFGSRGHGPWSRPAGAVAIALLFHGLLVLTVGVKHAVGGHDEAPPPKQVVATLEKPTPPAPPPPPPAPPRTPSPAARAPRLARAAPPRVVPPAPAQAGRVIAANEAAGPVDLTGFNLVVGEGKTYAGGYSATKGTSTKAVAAPQAVIGGRPDAAPPTPAQDYSRPASPAHRDWSCAWPEEEQTSDLRDARVTIRVSVDSDGAPTSVDILNAPPGGFAAAARRCAEGETYRAAHDARGRAIDSATTPFVVHFLR